MGAIMILDPAEADSLRDRYAAEHPDRVTEVWEGVTVVPPMPNNEHYRLSAGLVYAFMSVVNRDSGDVVVHGGNVTDRDDDWEQNYRCPDAVVVLAGGRAVDNGSHWTGGPDLVVEVISRGEDPQAKFDFYAGIGVRELMIVDRRPWAVELFRLSGGAFVSAGRADPTNGVEVASEVLPLAFRLEPGTGRPAIRIRHTGTGQMWTA